LLSADSFAEVLYAPASLAVCVLRAGVEETPFPGVASGAHVVHGLWRIRKEQVEEDSVLLRRNVFIRNTFRLQHVHETVLLHVRRFGQFLVKFDH